MLSYDILNTISIGHEYFAGGTCRSVTWLPSKETEQFCKSRGVILKQNNGQLTVAVGVVKDDDGKVTLGYSLQEPFELTFFAKFNEQNWSNITPVSPSRMKRLVFTNEEGGVLHSEEVVSDQHLTEVMFQQSLLEGYNNEKVNLQKLGSEEDCSNALEQRGEDLYLLTRKLEEGVYTISDGTKEERVFVTSEFPEFDAVFHLVYDPAFGKNNVLNEDWTWNRKDFKVQFEAKSTYWRYWIPQSGLDGVEGVRIVNGDDSGFNEGESVMAPNGQEMKLFSSNELLKLLEQPAAYFQLKKNVGVENRSEGVIISRLPIPGKDTIARINDEGKEFSDIYVYV